MELGAFGPDKRCNFGYINRIMKTELREKLEGDERYKYYKFLKEEYWIYSPAGAR